MKKILIAVLIVLLFILALTVILNGISVGGLEIPGYYSLIEKNEELDKKISEAAQITSVTFQEKEDSLKAAAKKLVEVREQYKYDVAYSSEEDVRRAREIKSYQVDFLFTKLGNYQSKYGLDLDLAATETSATGVYNLNFTLHGKYTLISEFIRAIENDSSLNFIIENFELVPDSNNDNSRIETLKATFVVTNLKLVIDDSIENSSEEYSMSGNSKQDSDTQRSDNARNNKEETDKTKQNANTDDTNGADNNTVNNTVGNTTSNTVSNTTNNSNNNNSTGATGNLSMNDMLN